MDEMKIGSKFMKQVIAKLVKMTLKRKLGYDMDIQLNELHVTVTDGKAHLHLNADAEMKTEELTKILKTAGLD